MAFLEDIDRTLTALGQGALQKTKEISNHAKVSITIKSLEEQKKESFVELGSIYYSLYKRDRDSLTEEFSQIVNRIYELDRQIEELKEQIISESYCPNCNTAIPLNSVFCNVCGTRVKEAEKEAALDNDGMLSAEQKKCSQCGNEIDDHQLFCTYCGRPVK